MRAVVRAATDADRFEILRLMEASHKEAAHRIPAMDYTRCMAHVDASIKVGFAAVAETDGKVVGALLGHVGEFWFSRECHAKDLFTYVMAEHRRTGAGLALYREFIRWAHANGFKVVLGQLSGIACERMERLFTRLGLVKMGASFIEA